MATDTSFLLTFLVDKLQQLTNAASLQGSNRAKAIMASMQEAHDQLTPFQQHASALDESLGAVIEAVEHNLHANSQQQPPQSLQGKPTKGFSKSKRAALVLDAMTPLLPAAMDQVRFWRYERLGLISGVFDFAKCPSCSNNLNL